MNRTPMRVLAGVALLAAPATAQDHAGMTMPMPGMPMPGMTMHPTPVPAGTTTVKGPARRMPAHRSAPLRSPTAPAASPASAAAMPAMDHEHRSGMATPDDATDAMAVAGTALPAGGAPPPPLPADHYADHRFGAAAMASARARMMRESGAQRLSQLIVNLAEYQVRGGEGGYRWDGEARFGGDITCAVIRSEGSGTVRHGVEAAEAQALYSHAIGPYFDLHAGIRHDVAPSSTRTYATLGVEGLAPYMFETGAAVFVSTRGDVIGRLEGWYDHRLTQRLVLQPRVELNLSMQDIPAARIGAGLADAELGLRLRYEVARGSAPYVGVSYEAQTGRTADYARARGRNATTASLVAGVRLRL